MTQSLDQIAHEFLGVMAATGEIDAARGLKICKDMKCYLKGLPCIPCDPLAPRFSEAILKWGITLETALQVIDRVSMRILKDAGTGARN